MLTQIYFPFSHCTSYSLEDKESTRNYSTICCKVKEKNGIKGTYNIL